MKKSLPKKNRIIWPDNTFFFLTTSTFLHYPFFKEHEQKQIVLNKIVEVCKYLEVPFQAFSISMNHFHSKFYLKNGALITKVKTYLHSGISREYRKLYRVEYEKIWHSTRVYFIKDEEASWKVTGYISGNLLKHREVSTFEELENCEFSSYSNTVKILGREDAQELVRSVIDVGEDNEGKIDLEGMRDVKITKYIN